MRESYQPVIRFNIDDAIHEILTGFGIDLPLCFTDPSGIPNKDALIELTNRFGTKFVDRLIPIAFKTAAGLPCHPDEIRRLHWSLHGNEPQIRQHHFKRASMIATLKRVDGLTASRGPGRYSNRKE